MNKLTNYEKHFKAKMANPKFRKAYKEEKHRLDIAYQILKLREKENLTQGKLAKKIGTTQSVIARIESGQINATTDTLGKIADVFDKRLALV